MGRTSERKIQKIKELREQGYTQQEIAHELDMDTKTVRAHDPKREKAGTENHQDPDSPQKLTGRVEELENLIRRTPNIMDNSTEEAQKQQEEIRQLEEERRQLKEEKVRLQKESSDLRLRLSSKYTSEKMLSELNQKLDDLGAELADLKQIHLAEVKPKDTLEEFVSHVEEGKLSEKEVKTFERIINDFNRRIQEGEGKKLVKVSVEEEAKHAEDEESTFVIPGTNIAVSNKEMEDSKYDEEHGVWWKRINQ